MSADRQRRRRGKPAGRRRQAREMAVQMLYQLEVGRVDAEDVFTHFDPLEYRGDSESSEAVGSAAGGGDRADKPADIAGAFTYAKTLVRGVLDNSEEIDQRIRFHAENWRLERMPLIDRNILRVAIYEMLFASDVPKVVIVDEAIELAKKFGAENSSRFVNGLLDGVLKARRAQVAEAVAEGVPGA